MSNTIIIAIITYYLRNYIPGTPGLWGPVGFTSIVDPLPIGAA